MIDARRFIFTGLGLGSMYGLLALGFYVTYAVSSTVNFAQGSSMMLGAVFAYTFAVTLGWPFHPGRRARARAVRRLRPGRRAGRGAAVRAARLERVADGDGRARHRRRQHGALHLRQGAARVRAAMGERGRLRCSASTCRSCSSRSRPSASCSRRRCTGSRAGRVRQGDAGGGAEPRRRAADGHQRAARHHRSPTRCRPRSPAPPAS